MKDAKSVDPLLSCLVFLTGRFGHAKSAQAITAGLAYDDKNMGPNLFCEAAEKAGLKAKIVYRDKIKKISAPVLPVVLTLKNAQACVLLKISGDEHSALIWSPETGSERTVRLTELKQDYTGYAIFVHPRPEFTDPDAPHAQDANRHWFWGPMWEVRDVYWKVGIAAVLINMFALTSPIFMMNIYNRVLPNHAMETGWVLAIGAITIFVFDFIMKTLRGYFIDIAGRRVDVIAARRIYDQLINMKLAGRPKSAGAFANMLRDFDSVRDFSTSATMTGLIDLPFTMLFLLVIWLLGGSVALMLAGLIVLVIIAGYALQVPLRNYVRKSTKSAEAKHGLLVETIAGLETIKAIGADGRLRARYGDQVAENALYAQGSRFVSALGGNIAALMQQIASIVIVLIGMYMVRDGDMSVGALIACVMLGSRAIAPIGQIANLMSRFHAAQSAMKTIDNIMAKPVERPLDARFLHRPDLKGKISLKNVTFSYPDSQRKSLEGVSFSLEAGEKVGIIGRIGSGKSTIARMVMGLYDPQDGTMLLDDTDYRQIDPADLRRNVAYIAQDVVLFSGTIRDNITASVPHATEEEILDAAKLAGVHDFVSRHPMGYDAPVGERGEGLSGGQRQAVALARAMLLKPSVFVCDEPTNAMDVQAEQAFTNHIARYSKNKTLILITHRPQLLPVVDRLILMDQGKVIADGPRDKVIEMISRGVEVPR
ncbi:MAG TPA: type I secretion system permease/ATPase [Micavibrio sp.]|nr:type I secretion system permease/ATPase [Micavibrio sp.]